MSGIADYSTIDDRDIDSLSVLSQSISSAGSFERISREVSSDEDDDIVYLRSSQESLPRAREDDSYVVVSGSLADELTSSLSQMSISPSSSLSSGPATSELWSDQVTDQDRSTPRPLNAIFTPSVSVANTATPTIIDVVNKAKPSSPATNVKKWKSSKPQVAKKKTVVSAPVSAKKPMVAAHAYPSPATTPVPTIKQSGLPVTKKAVASLKSQNAKVTDVKTISPPPSPSAQKGQKKKATHAVQNSQQTQLKAQIKTNDTVVSNGKTSNAGFGKVVVDDMSEAGDGHVDKVGLLSNAYKEAVEFMNSFIVDPGRYTSKASKLTFLQALILELGICHENVALPNSLTSAKAVLKSRAFVNVGEYLRVRSQGLDALRGIMHSSRSSLVRELRSSKKGKKVKLGLVKETGLTVLLVSCYQH